MNHRKKFINNHIVCVLCLSFVQKFCTLIAIIVLFFYEMASPFDHLWKQSERLENENLVINGEDITNHLNIEHWIKEGFIPPCSSKYYKRRGKSLTSSQMRYHNKGMGNGDIINSLSKFSEQFRNCRTFPGSFNPRQSSILTSKRDISAKD